MEILLIIGFFIILFSFIKSSEDTKKEDKILQAQNEWRNKKSEDLSSMTEYQKFKFLTKTEKELTRYGGSGSKVFEHMVRNLTRFPYEWIMLVESGCESAVIETGEMFLHDDDYSEIPILNNNISDDGGGSTTLSDIKVRTAIKLANKGDVRYIVAVALLKLKDASKVDSSRSRYPSYNDFHGNWPIISNMRNPLTDPPLPTHYFTLPVLTSAKNNLVQDQMVILKRASLSGDPVATQIIEWYKNENDLTKSKEISKLIDDAIDNLPFYGSARTHSSSGTGDSSREEIIRKNIGNTEDQTIYLVKISSKIDGKLYLKVGVTKHDDINVKFINDETVELEEICGFHTLPKELALRVEQHIIRTCRPTNDADEAFNAYSRFSGYTKVLDMRRIKVIKAGFNKIPAWAFNLDQKINEVKNS